MMEQIHGEPTIEEKTSMSDLEVLVHDGRVVANVLQVLADVSLDAGAGGAR